MMFRHHLVWPLAVWLLFLTVSFSRCGATDIGEEVHGVKKEEGEPYTFEHYLEVYGKTYSDPEEYEARRIELFVYGVNLLPVSFIRTSVKQASPCLLKYL